MNVDEFRESVNRYLISGYEPGGFVRAVLEDKLSETFRRADDDSLANLRDIVSYVYSDVPMMARHVHVHSVIAHGGLIGYMNYLNTRKVIYHDPQ